MLPLFMILCLAGIFGIAIYFFTLNNPPRSVTQILTDIGIHDNWSSEDTAPFYKWGWNESESNRISGERIVKNAFSKAKVCLDMEDLHFFENQCKKNMQSKPVNEEEIERRIHEIVHRSEMITQWTNEQIKKVIDFVTNTSQEEAVSLLYHAGVKVEQDKALPKLCTIELRRLINRLGSQILGLENTSLEIRDEKTEQIIHLRSLDAWSQLIKIIKDALVNQAKNTAYAAYPEVLRVIKSSANGNLIKELIKDVERADLFRRNLNNSIREGSIQLPPERINACDSIMYSWKFSDGIRFNQVDHDRTRDLLMSEEFSAHFRELLIRRLDEQFSCLQGIVNMFPRNVMFYGSNQLARSFTTDQYSRHLMALLECMAPTAGCDSIPPTIINVLEDDLDHILRVNKRGMVPEAIRDLITEKQQRMTLEMAMNEETARARGWIINLALKEVDSEELSQLSKPPFKRYIRFNCDSGTDVDLKNNTYHAKQSRINFFNMIIDSLVEIPALNKKNNPATIHEEKREVEPAFT